MTKVSIEIHDDVVTTIFKIKNINDQGVELEIPEGSVLFDNILNLKLIKKETEKYGITVHFFTRDEVGNNMIQSIDEDTESIAVDVEELQESNISEPAQEAAEGIQGIPDLSTISVPKIKLPPVRLPNIQMKKISALKPILLGVVPVVIIFGVLLSLTKNQHATAEITIASQPLARSFPVKVMAGQETNVNTKVLKGTTLSVLIDNSKDIATTGEKIIGKKAEGSVKIYNDTTSEKKFKKGTELQYKTSKETLSFFTTEDITIPKTITSGTDPDDPDKIISTRGSEVVEVIAGDFGSKYNLAEDKEVTIRGQKSSEFSGLVSSDIKGGKSETVKAVTLEDKTKLKEELLQDIVSAAEQQLQNKAGYNQTLIKGSTKTTIIKETYSKDTDEEADKLTLSLSVQAEGLMYQKSDINTMMDSMVQSYIPEGFMLSNKEREVTTDVLGNSSSSVLNSNTADIQVTFKTYVVPDISEDKLKQQLAGQKITDAQKILGAIKNIKGYNLKVSPNIPLLNSVPKNPKQIEIIIQRN
jgi:hypothetical protein